MQAIQIVLMVFLHTFIVFYSALFWFLYGIFYDILDLSILFYYTNSVVLNTLNYDLIMIN